MFLFLFLLFVSVIFFHNCAQAVQNLHCTYWHIGLKLCSARGCLVAPISASQCSFCVELPAQAATESKK